jgi:hypothetical protein
MLLPIFFPLPNVFILLAFFSQLEIPQFTDLAKFKIIR